MINLVENIIKREWIDIMSIPVMPETLFKLYVILDIVIYPFHTIRTGKRQIELSRNNYYEDLGRYLELYDNTFKLTVDRDGIISSTKGNLEHILSRLHIKYKTKSWQDNVEKLLFNII